MSSGLTSRLQEILETEAETEARDSYSGSGLKRVMRVAKFLRTVGIVALLGVLATIAVPIPLSPMSARALGIAGLIVVASGIALYWLFHSQISPEGQQQALSQILGWSDRITELEETGRPLNPRERTAAIAHVRSFAVQNYIGYRFRSHLDSKSSEMLVPDLPLPPATRAALVRTRDFRPVYSTANWIVAAPWFILMYFILWTSLFLLTWAAGPEPCAVGASACAGALQGFGTSPSIGDFVFLVLNASASNMPPDLTPRSDLAHLVFAGSFISAIGVLAITATGLWGRLKRQMEHRAFHN